MTSEKRYAFDVSYFILKANINPFCNYDTLNIFDDTSELYYNIQSLSG